jgi:plasmid maintenance system antidote protein VapI
MGTCVAESPPSPGEVLLEDVIKPLGITITDAAKDLGDGSPFALLTRERK